MSPCSCLNRKKSSNLKYSLFGCCFAKKITIVELLTPKNDDENWSNDTFVHFDLKHCKLHGSKSFWVGHLHGKMHTLCCFSQNRKAEQLLFLLWIVEPPKGEHEIQISRWFLNLPTCGFESVYCSEMTNWPPDYRHILLHYKHFGPTATIHMFQRWIKKKSATCLTVRRRFGHIERYRQREREGEIVFGVKSKFQVSKKRNQKTFKSVKSNSSNNFGWKSKFDWNDCIGCS